MSRQLPTPPPEMRVILVDVPALIDSLVDERAVEQAVYDGLRPLLQSCSGVKATQAGVSILAKSNKAAAWQDESPASWSPAATLTAFRAVLRDVSASLLVNVDPSSASLHEAETSSSSADGAGQVSGVSAASLSSATNPTSVTRAPIHLPIRPSTLLARTHEAMERRLKDKDEIRTVEFHWHPHAGRHARFAHNLLSALAPEHVLRPEARTRLEKLTNKFALIACAVSDGGAGRGGVSTGDAEGEYDAGLFEDIDILAVWASKTPRTPFTMVMPSDDDQWSDEAISTTMDDIRHGLGGELAEVLVIGGGERGIVIADAKKIEQSESLDTLFGSW